MSLISKVLKFFASVNQPETPPPPPKPTNPPTPKAAPRPSPGIYVDLIPRMGGQRRTMPFAYDQPELAFQHMLSFLMSDPLLHDSIKGVRVNADGAREVIFEVSMRLNGGTNTYDYAPSFPGSWHPPETFKVIQRLPA
ncbi:hypothetical protein PMN64_12525 [Bradyrhizobium sp. UFLA01-814]|uniref:hypothetical protein n=1 Tax=Bradyrhizobium sp. UFLA01-814 TaxID=3023480 RepID=UPI00398BA154